MADTAAAIAASSANDVSLSAYKVTYLKALGFAIDLDYLTDKLMTYDHRSFYRFLRPFVPFVNMYVSTADGYLMDLNKCFSIFGSWHVNSFHPKAPFGEFFNKRTHFHFSIPRFALGL
jgi:hypothetical protein